MMKTLKIKPAEGTTMEVTAFVEQAFEELPPKVAMKMNIAIDELYSNILLYSRATEAEIQCGTEDGTAVLRLIDNGIPYDPTAKPDPDTTLSAEERKIGGLGIFMVKKSMDSMTYERRDGQNILVVKKALQTK